MATAGDRSTPDPAVPPAGRPRVPRLGLGRVARLCLKELREILRDRRTTITLVLMPLLAYPLLAMTFHGLLLKSFRPLDQTRLVIGVPNREAEDQVYAILSYGDEILRGRGAGLGAEPGEEGAAERPTHAILFQVGPELHEMVAAEEVDVAVLVLEAPRPDGGGRRPFRCELIMRKGSSISEYAARFVEERLQAVNEYRVGPLLAAAWRRNEIASADAPVSLTAFFPLILILMTITGAVYPAIDLTAGERERGTLETLMAAPVPRLGLLCAKYVAVVTVAMLTASANLVAMSVTLLVTPGLGPLVFGESGLTLLLVDQVFVLLILFAAFYSAILLAVTSFARSFKEAQAYLIPLMLMTLAPGMFSLMPGLEFSGALAVMPLINIVLLARDLLEGVVNPTLAAVSVLSTLLYAVAAIAIAARIFGTDAILYGSQATWSDMLRRPRRASDVATVSGAMLFLAVVFPIYFLMANVLQRFAGASIAVRLGLSALVTAILFGALPLGAAAAQRVRLKTGFQLYRPPVLALLGAVVLGLTLWPFAHEIFLLNQLLGLQTLGAEQMETVHALLSELATISPVVILLCLALVPAVFEELFFRGYLQSALRGSLRGPTAVAVSAILFGLFHVVATSVLATERFLPSTFLGLVLGWVCLRSGSLWPGMVLHACHNGLLLMIAYYRDELIARGWGIEEQSHMPAIWLGAAALGLVLGGALVHVAKLRRSA